MLTNRQLIIPYTAPYLAYVGIASIPSRFVSIEVNYLLRVFAVSLLLLWARRWYCTLTGPKSLTGSLLTGTGAGVIGVILWIALLSPFTTAANSTPWSFLGFLLRLFCAGLLVPFFEEIMMRGFIFRLALQWDTARKKRSGESLQTLLDEHSVNEVKPGQWSWLAVIISTLFFAAGHAMYEWPAALSFGLLMAFLWVYRKDLVACITAHAVANTALALYVFTTGNWHYW